MQALRAPTTQSKAGRLNRFHRSRWRATSVAKVLGFAGSLWGILLTLVQVVYLLPQQGAGVYGSGPTIRFAMIGLALYGASLLGVARGLRRFLVLVLILLVPLNVRALASVGLLLAPGTVLLVLAAALLWIGGRES